MYFVPNFMFTLYIIFHYPLPQRAHNHFIDVTELCLFCIYFFSIATDPSEHVIYLFIYLLYSILFKVLKSKLQTLHFLRRYRTKANTVLESKAVFVHLNCIVISCASWTNTQFAWTKAMPSSLVSRTVNNY
jgi:hypothetical protein